ncbi:MAG: hydrogenase iron-sulfur subunit [Candidatus Coatesbacteria bacterium]|nr:MAG: hydrogenase iron-sulfur subunit [Candidatus Coatesbacteria bacterium]
MTSSPDESTAEKKEKASSAPKGGAKAKGKAAPKAAKTAGRKKAAAKKAPSAKASAPRRAARKKEGAKKAAAAFTPRIVVFACNWCSYAGADTAGISRLQYSPNFRIIRVMCSGRVHPAFVLRAFELGADGVLVSGCHFGDCHYIFGNERAVEQFEKTKRLLQILGLEEGRLRLEWISAAEGTKFAAVINEFVAQVGALGPSKLAPRELELPQEAEEFADAASLAK